MEEQELLTKAAEGDKNAYYKWQIQNRQHLANFAFQNGLPADKCPLFAESIFQEIRPQLANKQPTDAKLQLYEKALKQIRNTNFEQDSQVIRFDEDRETHTAIRSMNDQWRIPLLLMEFHAFSAEQTAALLSVSPSRVSETKAEALDELKKALSMQTLDMTEKRIGFLKKSYDRLTFPFSETEATEEVVDETGSVENLMPIHEKAVKKRSTVVIAAVTLFLGAVISGSFIWNDPNSAETAVSGEQDEMVLNRATRTEWKNIYEDTRTETQEKLGMDENSFERLTFVQESDEAFNESISRETFRRYKDEPEKAERLFQKAILQIQTPSAMVDSLREHTFEEQDLREVMDQYTSKTKELMANAEAILIRNQEDLKVIVSDGNPALGELLMQKNSLPSEVENLVDSLDEQMLTVTGHPNEKRLTVKRDLSLLYEYANVILSPDIHQYLYFLENAPYFDESGLLLPKEHMGFILSDMERYIINAKRDDFLYEEVEYMFQHVFWLLMKGTDNEQVTGTDGKIKTEYREAWNVLLTHSSSNPIVYVLIPIIDEFERSDWTYSESYENLAYPDILEAVELEREGLLQGQLPGSELAVQTETLHWESEEELFARVEELYKEFSQRHDSELLERVPALNVYLLYEYANSLKDSETMWHMLADDPLKPSLQQFQTTYRPGEKLTDYAEWIESREENVYRTGRSLRFEPIVGFTGTGWRANPVLVSENDTTWKVKYQLFESYELRNDESGFRAQVEALYTDFSVSLADGTLSDATPGEVGGVFLIAAEKEDYETMYALLDETVKTDIDSFKQSVAKSDLRLDSYDRLFFHSDSYQYDEGLPMGWLQLSRHDMEEGHPMVKTEKGWRLQMQVGY